VGSDSRAFSAKLVRICEITANFHRCKNIFEKIWKKFVNKDSDGGNGGKKRFTAETPREKSTARE
jgi:hypothetical protein